MAGQRIISFLAVVSFQPHESIHQKPPSSAPVECATREVTVARSSSWPTITTLASVALMRTNWPG